MSEARTGSGPVVDLSEETPNRNSLEYHVSLGYGGLSPLVCGIVGGILEEEGVRLSRENMSFETLRCMVAYLMQMPEGRRGLLDEMAGIRSSYALTQGQEEQWRKWARMFKVVEEKVGKIGVEKTAKLEVVEAGGFYAMRESGEGGRNWSRKEWLLELLFSAEEDERIVREGRIVIGLVEMDEVLPGVLPERDSRAGMRLQRMMMQVGEEMKRWRDYLNSIRRMRYGDVNVTYSVERLVMTEALEMWYAGLEEESRKKDFERMTRFVEGHDRLFPVRFGVFRGGEIDRYRDVVYRIRSMRSFVLRGGQEAERWVAMRRFMLRSWDVMGKVWLNEEVGATSEEGLIVQAWLWKMPPSMMEAMLENPDALTEAEVKAFWKTMKVAGGLIAENSARICELKGWDGKGKGLRRKTMDVEDKWNQHLAKVRAWWRTYVLTESKWSTVGLFCPELFLQFMMTPGFPDVEAGRETRVSEKIRKRLMDWFAYVRKQGGPCIECVGRLLEMSRYAQVVEGGVDYWKWRCMSGGIMMMRKMCLCPVSMEHTGYQMLRKVGIEDRVEVREIGARMEVGASGARGRESLLVEIGWYSDKLNVERKKKQSVERVEVENGQEIDEVLMVLLVKGGLTIECQLGWTSGSEVVRRFGSKSKEWLGGTMALVRSLNEQLLTPLDLTSVSDGGNVMEVVEEDDVEKMVPMSLEGGTVHPSGLMWMGGLVVNEKAVRNRIDYAGYTKQSVHSLMFNLEALEGTGGSGDVMRFGTLKKEGVGPETDELSILKHVKDEVDEVCRRQQDEGVGLRGMKVEDGMWMNMVVFKTIAGHCVWMNKEAGMAELGPGLRGSCWRGGKLMKQGGNVIRFVKASLLGEGMDTMNMVLMLRGGMYDKGGYAADTRTSHLGGLCVLPDKVWDVMVPLLEKGIGLCPQTIDCECVSEYCVPCFNGSGAGRCRGGIGKPYRHVTVVGEIGNDEYGIGYFSQSRWLMDIGSGRSGMNERACPQPWEAMTQVRGRANDELAVGGGVGVIVDVDEMVRRLEGVFGREQVSSVPDNMLVDWVTSQMASKVGVLVTGNMTVSEEDRDFYLLEWVFPYRTALGIWTWLRSAKVEGRRPFKALCEVTTGSEVTMVKEMWERITVRGLQVSKMVGPGLKRCTEGGWGVKGVLDVDEMVQVAYAPYKCGFNGECLVKDTTRRDYLKGSAGRVAGHKLVSEEVVAKWVEDRVKGLNGHTPEGLSSDEEKRVQETLRRIQESAVSVV